MGDLSETRAVTLMQTQVVCLPLVSMEQMEEENCKKLHLTKNNNNKCVILSKKQTKQRTLHLIDVHRCYCYFFSYLLLTDGRQLVFLFIHSFI